MERIHNTMDTLEEEIVNDEKGLNSDWDEEEDEDEEEDDSESDLEDYG